MGVKTTSRSVQLDVMNQELEEISSSVHSSTAALVSTTSPVCPATPVYDTDCKLPCNSIIAEYIRNNERIIARLYTNSTQDNVYGAIVITKSLGEFTRFI